MLYNISHNGLQMLQWERINIAYKMCVRVSVCFHKLEMYRKFLFYEAGQGAIHIFSMKPFPLKKQIHPNQ